MRGAYVNYFVSDLPLAKIPYLMMFHPRVNPKDGLSLINTCVVTADHQYVTPSAVKLLTSNIAPATSSEKSETPLSDLLWRVRDDPFFHEMEGMLLD